MKNSSIAPLVAGCHAHACASILAKRQHDTHQISGRQIFRALKLPLLAIALTIGCGSPPQMGANNHRLVHGLHTAISARRVDWLDSTAKLISERHENREMNDEQFAAFESIIAQSRAGDWEGAESEVLRLAKAQRATAAEDEAVKSRKTSGPVK